MNGSPSLMFVLPRNDLVYYSSTIKKDRHILNVGQDLINTFCDTGDTSLVILGVIFGIIHFSQSETPKNVISCRHQVFITSDIFEITPKITPR